MRISENLFPIAVFALLRLATAAAAVMGLRAAPPEWFVTATPSNVSYQASLPDGAPLYALLEPWRRYDTTWYAHLALTGYAPDSVGIVFPPGYPLAIRALTPLAGSAVGAALLISSAASLAAFVLLYRMMLRHFGSAAHARRMLLLVAAFPTAFYLMAGYTEAPFVALLLGALAAAEGGRWGWAAACAGVLALTRIQGFLVALPLAWMAFSQWRCGARLRPMMAAAIAVPLVSFAGYLAYLHLNGLGTLDAAWLREWRAVTAPPWVTVGEYLDRLRRGVTLPHENRDAAAVVFMALTCAALVVRAWRDDVARWPGCTARPPWMTYALVALPAFTLFLMRYVPGEAQFNSVSRYAILLFPCFAVAAGWLRRDWLLACIVVASWAWQLALLAQFAGWGWVA